MYQLNLINLDFVNLFEYPLKNIFSHIIIKSVLITLSFIIAHESSFAQNTMYWFDAHSKNSEKMDHLVSADCQLVKDGIDKETGIYTKEYEQRPLFMHTHPEFKKWMKDKYLMECSANLYNAGETAFLLLHFKINSENAKHAYGNLNKGSQIKITFEDKEHIYLENIERDRGSAKRSKKYTSYKGVYPLDKGKVKELQKRGISKIGIVWEEGYQEYEVFNSDLIQNQAICLKSK